VVLVIAQLILYIQREQQTARYAQRKAGNVDQGVDFAAKQIPEGDFQVTLKHDCLV